MKQANHQLRAKRTNNQRGLTLIEVLISMGIATIAGVLLVVIMVNSAGLFTKESSKVQQGLNINDALATVRSSITQASSVSATYTNGSTTYTSSANQLVLKISSIDSAGNIIDNIFDYLVVFADQKVLHFKVFPNASSSRKSVDRIFSTSVDSLNFKYFNNATPPIEVTPTSAVRIRISITLKQKNGINIESSIATSEANLRND